METFLRSRIKKDDKAAKPAPMDANDRAKQLEEIYSIPNVCFFLKLIFHYLLFFIFFYEFILIFFFFKK